METLDISEIIFGVKFALLYVLLLLIFKVVAIWKSFTYPIVLVLYLGSIIAYLGYESPLSNNPVYLWTTLPIVFLLPYLFWLFTKILFEDDLVLDYKHVLLGGLVLIICVSSTIFGQQDWMPEFLSDSFDKIPELLESVFVINALVLTYSGIKTEISEKRLRFRIIFISFNSAIIILTGLFGFDESRTVFNAGGSLLQLFQLSMILLLLTIFVIYIINIRKGFFLVKPVELIAEDIDEKLQNRIEQLFKEEKVYLEENISISSLAEKLNEKEYVIRKVINKQMNYKNFNEFLNKYRIYDACQVLADPEQSKVTVLEICYTVGFHSLAPFNRAFKGITGKTPTEYRKEKLDKKKGTL